LLTTERELVEGDVLWVDTGIMYGGYHSDFGRTWVVGKEPTGRQQAQYRRWREISDAVTEVMHAGATGADLTHAAMAVCGGARPWMPHFYIGHGLGLDSAEMPFVGTDLGDEFDAGLVLASGTVVVVEPIVWEEGYSGYRSENVFVITEDGSMNLSDYPYDPYGD
jgi:Xaa-Pro aminopeptidase